MCGEDSSFASCCQPESCSPPPPLSFPSSCSSQSLREQKWFHAGQSLGCHARHWGWTWHSTPSIASGGVCNRIQGSDRPIVYKRHGLSFSKAFWSFITAPCVSTSPVASALAGASAATLWWLSPVQGTGHPTSCNLCQIWVIIVTLSYILCICCDISEKNWLMLFIFGTVIGYHVLLMHVSYHLALCQIWVLVSSNVLIFP